MLHAWFVAVVAVVAVLAAVVAVAAVVGVETHFVVYQDHCYL